MACTQTHTQKKNTFPVAACMQESKVEVSETKCVMSLSVVTLCLLSLQRKIELHVNTLEHQQMIQHQTEKLQASCGAELSHNELKTGVKEAEAMRRTPPEGRRGGSICARGRRSNFNS